MRAPSAADVIAMWEQGASQGAIERPLAVLARLSGEPRETLAALCLGERDARLFALHAHLFGPRVEAFAECPHCGERLEYAIAADELLQQPQPQTDPSGPTLDLDDATVRLRRLDTADLAAATACIGVDEARRLLARRCIVAASREEAAVPVGDLTEAAVERIADCLAAADPQADLSIDLMCPSCAHRWTVAFRIERFLWGRLAALATRLLREVDVLARAYGWSEHEILSLSATRRALYLEMAS